MPSDLDPGAVVREPAANTAPTMVMPEIAFDPTSSGVCNVGGIFVMISNPMKIASAKIGDTGDQIHVQLSVLPSGFRPRYAGML
jgi:hypothetical protein